MAQIIFPRRSGSKPSVGLQINWGHPQAQGLVFLTLLAEGGGIAPIDSVTRQSGSLGNSNGWISSRIGTALSFNGTTTGLSFAANGLTNFSGRLSVEVLFNPAISTAYQTLLSKNTNQSARDYTIILVANDTSSVYISTGGLDQGGVALAFPWVINTWNHIVMTADGTNVRIYVNGRLANTTATTGVATSVGAAIEIGREIVGGSFPLNGAIGKTAVYKRVLAANEIIELYMNPFCMLTPPGKDYGIGFSPIPSVPSVIEQPYREPLGIVGY